MSRAFHRSSILTNKSETIWASTLAGTDFVEDPGKAGRVTYLTALGEKDVDPIVGRVVGVDRESAGASVSVNSVASAGRVGQGGKRSIGQSIGVIVPVRRIETGQRVVRGDVSRPRRDRNWSGEKDLLPAAGSFISKVRRGEQPAAHRPEIPDVGTSVLRALVESYSNDLPGG